MPHRLLVLVVALATISTTVASCGRTDARESGRMVAIDSLHAFDVGNPNKLASWSSHVFTGRVESIEGTRTIAGATHTHWRIDVKDRLKGSTAEVVVVAVQGGLNDSGELEVVDGDQPLTIGSDYLFITRVDDKDVYHAVPKYGDIKLDVDAQAKIDRIRRALMTPEAWNS